jgi:hypothetical protein
MMKRLAIVVLFASILPVHGQQQSTHPGSDQQTGQSAQKPASSPSRVVTCEIKQERTTIECKWPEAISESKLQRLFSPENAPNIALVVIGFGGVLAAALTLRKIKIQADEMRLQRVAMETTLKVINRQADLMEAQGKDARDSAAASALTTQATLETLNRQADSSGAMASAAQENANAAVLNTQSLINSERAWIVVSVESPVPGQFNFRATNVGRTPATVKSIWHASLVAKRGEVLQVPLDEKTGKSLMDTPPCLIPPTANQIVHRCNIEDMEKKGAFGQNMTFALGLSNLWFYGRIVYSDVLQLESSPLHETKWLYWHVPVEGAIPFPDPMRSQHNTYT